MTLESKKDKKVKRILAGLSVLLLLSTLGVAFASKEAIQDDMYFGLVDQSGRWTMAPGYSYAGTTVADNGLLEVRTAIPGEINVYAGVTYRTQAWGYVDSSGKLAITPNFSGAKSFGSSEYAPAESRENGRWGLIDTSGEWLWYPRYLELGVVQSNGLAYAVNEDNIYGYVGVDGEWVIKPRFKRTFDFSGSDNRAVVVDAATGRYGLIDEKGNWVAEPLYLSMDDSVSMGLVAAQDASIYLWGYLDQSGNWAIPPQYAKADRFSENNLAAVKDVESGSYGCIDNHGNWVIEAKFARIGSYSQNGYAPAKDSATNLFGYIDTQGTWIIEPQFGLANSFDNELGYAGVKDASTGLWGYIDQEGEWLIEPRFGAAYGFTSEGLALVRNKKIDNSDLEIYN